MTDIKAPLTLKNGVTLKNRVVMSPMTTKMSFYNGVITKDEIEYYALRSGEVGMVITGAANVQADGKGWEGELGVFADHLIPGLAKLAAGIKKSGTKAILQIFHAGRMTDSSVLRGVQPVSASAVAAEHGPGEVPREMTEVEIEQVIENFKQATVRAIQAGFDGVEIHGANTYLIQQFFSPHSNRRTDQWGGSLENRYRFVERIVDAVTAAVAENQAKDFIVGYRFSPEEYETPGIRFADTLFLVDRLADKPLSYLHISLNAYGRVSASPNYQVKSMLAYINELINGRIPLIGIGDVRGKADLDAILQQADLAAVGRSLLIDPHFTAKVFAGKENLIRREIDQFDREELLISDGVMEFLVGMMPDRLV